jgi:ubiquinol-cytochrome c reductase cytochrome b subunit
VSQNAVVFVVVRRICVGLQREDKERLRHGLETGVVRRSVEGGYSEDVRRRELTGSARRES